MILITGARGFIGSNLVTCLEAGGNIVLQLSRSDSFKKDASHLFLDLTSKDHLRHLKSLDIRPDTVIHLAGHIEISLKANPINPAHAPVPGPEDLPAIYRSNILATVNLIEFCREASVKHIIFASSQAVYGLPPTERITEETPCNPLEHYALSKECCEKILRLVVSDGIAVTIFRFPGVYSEMRDTGTVARFCQSALRYKLIRVTADLPLPFDVIHLEDVLNAFSCALATEPKKYEIYNIATGEPASLNLLADRIAGLVPGCRVEHAACPQPVIRIDPAKAERRYAWKAVPSQVRLQQVLDSVQL